MFEGKNGIEVGDHKLETNHSEAFFNGITDMYAIFLEIFGIVVVN